MKSIDKKKQSKRNAAVTLTLMALPALIVLLIFRYLPMFGLVIAFKDFEYDKGIFDSAWAGFKNFEFFLQSQDAVKTVRNTFIMNGMFIFTVTIGSVLLAIFLNEITSKRLIKTYQTVMLLPYFLSMTVVANIVYGFLDFRYGIANQAMVLLGKDPVIWYNEDQYWRTLLVVINWWKNVGYNTIIFYAGVIGIDPSYYEAASVDGAKKGQIFRKITIPMLMPLVVTMLIIQTGGILYGDTGLFYVVTKNSALLYDKIDIIDTYVLRALTGSNSDIGMASAVGMFQSIVGFVLVMLANALARRYNENSALF